MSNSPNCELYRVALLLWAVCACGRELMADPDGGGTLQISAAEVVVQPDEYTRVLSNTKVIPRVYLHWAGDRKYWPTDIGDEFA